MHYRVETNKALVATLLWCPISTTTGFGESRCITNTPIRTLPTTYCRSTYLSGLGWGWNLIHSSSAQYAKESLLHMHLQQSWYCECIGYAPVRVQCVNALHFGAIYLFNIRHKGMWCLNIGQGSAWMGYCLAIWIVLHFISLSMFCWRCDNSMYLWIQLLCQVPKLLALLVSILCIPNLICYPELHPNVKLLARMFWK